MKLMKGLVLVLTISCLLSCTNDAEVVEISEESLKGNWKITEFTHTETRVIQRGESEKTEKIEIEGSGIDAYVVLTTKPNTFKAEGKYTATIKVNGVEVSVEEREIGNTFFSGAWTLDNDNFIVISPDGESQTGKVLEVSSNVLRLELEGNFDNSDLSTQTNTNSESTTSLRLIK